MNKHVFMNQAYGLKHLHGLSYQGIYSIGNSSCWTRTPTIVNKNTMYYMTRVEGHHTQELAFHVMRACGSNDKWHKDTYLQFAGGNSQAFSQAKGCWMPTSTRECFRRPHPKSKQKKTLSTPRESFNRKTVSSRYRVFFSSGSVLSHVSRG